MAPAPEKLPSLVTPGEILEKDFMKPLGVSTHKLARDLGVREETIQEIIAGRRRISKTMAHRLHIRFKVTTQFWLSAQAHYDQQALERWQMLAKK